MLEIVEFFLVYDFVFFKSMVDWSNEQRNNGLAWLIEYGRVLQFSVLLASGVHQILCLLSCCKFGLVGGLLLAFNFLGMSLVLPTLALLATIHVYGMEYQTLHDVLHPTLVPFSAGLITAGFLLLVARKQLLKLNHIEILLTKLIILWQLLIVLQSLISATANQLWLYALNSRPWLPMLNTTEDIFRPCYPLVYLILFRHENVADWVFNWCLSHKNGAHRLSSTNDLHEMQSGISLDNSIFSVQLEEDDDGIDEGNPRQPLAGHDGTIDQLLLQK